MNPPLIKVLVVDDSAVIRQAASAVLSESRGFKVTTAADPLIAMMKTAKERPDVIVLDIEMPRMDGLTFLQRIMAEDPIPVVICSGIAERGSAAAMRALQIGAVDVIAKPSGKALLADWGVALVDAVNTAACAEVKRLRRPLRARPQAESGARRGVTRGIVVMGASTGGTEAITHVLQQFPKDAPPIVVVQHMPERFTAAFARRLDGTCAIRVRECEDGDILERGTAFIAPGNRHVVLARTGPNRFAVVLNDSEPVNRHRPSIDVLFHSAAAAAGADAVGVLLTGMGRDGAAGLLAMRKANAFTIAQDEETSIVFGMPKAAIELGAAVRICPLDAIAAAILGASQSGLTKSAETSRDFATD